MGKKPKKNRTRRTVLKALLAIILFSIILVASIRIIPPPFFGILIARQLTPATNEPKPIQYNWVPLSQISCHLICAAIAAEDQKFHQHAGFDNLAIKAAIRNNLSGGPLRGGSTITQQTAKNLFLWPSRSWLRKGLEAYMTVLIESLWRKDRILEVYLNIIEMGDNIYGAEAAANTYFGKHASTLTKAESALLAAILPAPLTRDPTRPTPSLKRKQAWILRQMAQMKPSPLCEAPLGEQL